MKITEHEMLVTLANMALKMNDLTGADVLDALKQLDYGNVIEEAREIPPTDRKLSPEDKKFKDFLDKHVSKATFFIDEGMARTHERIYGSKDEQLAKAIESATTQRPTRRR